MNEARAVSSVNFPSDSLAYLLFIGLMVAFGLYAVFITGPNMRAAAQQQLAQTTADENGAFCGKFGMRVGSSEFVDCSQGPAIVRQKQADRDSADAHGIP